MNWREYDDHGTNASESRSQDQRLELTAELCGLQRMSDRDAIASMLNQLSVTLAEVMGALRALDGDSCGNCIRCDRPIALKRLQSIPWAAYCVRCQEQIEAEGSEPDFARPKAA